MTGVARKLKERLPKVKIVGVDPDGSLLAGGGPEVVHGYLVEGIGYDFVPKVCEQDLVDIWVKSYDKEYFLAARRLISTEGLLCGGSSGAALCGALEAAKQLGPGQRCVVLLADSIRNYLGKFVSDSWMIERGFSTPEAGKTYKPVLDDVKVMIAKAAKIEDPVAAQAELRRLAALMQ